MLLFVTGVLVGLIIAGYLRRSSGTIAQVNETAVVLEHDTLVEIAAKPSAAVIALAKRQAATRTQ